MSTMNGGLGFDSYLGRPGESEAIGLDDVGFFDFDVSNREARMAPNFCRQTTGNIQIYVVCGEAGADIKSVPARNTY